MSITLETIDKDLLSEAEEVLDYIGMDITTAIKMMLKKIKNEKDVSFLLTKASEQAKTTVLSNEKDVPFLLTKAFEQPKTAVLNPEKSNSKMTKNKAIYLFISKGFKLCGNITFASKNKAAYNYWANPDISILSSDWCLILNDWNKQELHLFFIPKNSISKFEIIPRNDKQNQIDLQIMYDDSSFTDTRSKISFKQYLLETINY